MTICRFLTILTAVFLTSSASAQTLNPRPVKALGVPRLLATQSNPGALDSVNPNYIDSRDLFSPAAVALDFSSTPPSVYIADTANNRVLGWKYASQLANGAPADIVLGQSSIYSTLPQGPGGLTIGLNAPTGIAVDKAGNVYVADTGDNRILRFPQPFAQTDTLKTPDLVIGQSGFGSAAPNPLGFVTANSLFLNAQQGFPPHVGMALDGGGNLFVGDVGNNRVVRYPAAALSAGTNGPSADLVLGQTNFSTNANAQNNRTNKAALQGPLGVAFDSAGRLFVADNLARVLVYTPGFTTGSAAVRILGVAISVPGQPAPAQVSAVNVGFVSSVTIGPGNRPIVVDSGYNRVLVYDTFDNWPAETMAVISPTAQSVIGQTSFSMISGNEGFKFPNQSTLLTPFDAAASANELYIVDTNNNRVLNYPFPSGGPSLSASRVLGQVNFNLFSPNFVEGRGFSLSTSGLNGSIIIDRNANPPHLYVADTANNRILGFNDFNNAKTGDSADIVIGQSNFFSTAFNNVSNDPAAANQAGLNHPTALALDTAGNLYVADTGNSRVLRFPRPFSQPGASNQSADLVLGQANFNSVVSSATNRTMQTPTGVAVLSDGSILASDAALNRVLFFQQPLASGMIATKVLGQTDFNSPSNNSGGTTLPSPSRFSAPRQIAVDPQDRVYVCDTGNSRIAIFDTIGNLSPTLPAPAISISSGLNQPVGITIGAANTPNAGQLWVSDIGVNAVYHYPPFAQLLFNSTADLAQTAFHPMSAAFDSFGDLAVADSANRVVLFVPQLTISNGSSFATGPVAPGTIISVFSSPAPATSSSAILATTTANFNSLANPLPLPTTLGGIQVLVNGSPAPLFYVSPTQINLPLPSTLPVSGTVDLEIVSQTSSRIYGLTEISLAAVSPGLFTLAGSGGGQLAALNAPDNSINTASKPLVRGQILVLFGTGEGPVPNGPPDGTPATTATPTADQPRIVIGGVDVQSTDILYSGLAPGLVGVWQINVRIPQEVTAGNQVPVVVYLRSVSSQLGTFIALR